VYEHDIETVALVIQHTKCMRCIVWPIWLYHVFPHLINGMIFGKKLLNVKCVS